MPIRPIDLIAVSLALALSLALTPLVRAFARRRGFVARPKSDRWHKKPTALLGGAAIFASVAPVVAALGPGTRQTYVLLGAGAFMFLLGLVDDVVCLKPYQKLVGQMIGAMMVIASGLTLPWTGAPAADMAITALWLVGITNAVNLLDNMDGLAAGVAMIGASVLALNFGTNGHPDDARMLAILAAALLGYLAYNSHPASIFMGDCGSMFIGFFLAGTALLNPTSGRSRSFLPVLAVPVLILFIPIFDTVFVTVLRKLAGRSASQGGRDHTSHRLVALGLSERRAVWMLYAFAAGSGLLALLVRDLALDVSLAAIVGFTIVLTLLGVHLAGVKVYKEGEFRPASDQPIVAFLVDLSHKRRLFEVLLDAVLIVLSYYVAYALVFGPIMQAGAQREFLRMVAVLVCVKLAVFLAIGMYRGLWRYVSLESLVLYTKGVAVGSAASILVGSLLARFPTESRVVFVLDGLILLFCLAGSRAAFRLFRLLIPASGPDGARRVLIYGAGDAGELLLRELSNNRQLQYLPIGFLDDDPLKKGKVIHGLRVLGGNGSFLSICAAHRADEVLISSAKFSDERLRELARQCESAEIALKRLRLSLEPLSPPTTALAPSTAANPA